MCKEILFRGFEKVVILNFSFIKSEPGIILKVFLAKGQLSARYSYKKNVF